VTRRLTARVGVLKLEREGVQPQHVLTLAGEAQPERVDTPGHEW
jgi:hypothetical protein